MFAMTSSASAAPTALELHRQIISGEKTAVSLVEASYRQIGATDSEIHAFVSLTKDLALETAQNVDRKAKAGEPLPLLAGVPIAVKDNINVQGFPTTCSSRILDGYISPYDATVTQKLKQHQLPILGKTNLDEFAMGSSTENSALGVTRNPWDTSRVPGGSSGGSAAAVAAGDAPLSLGSDTGGSVRQPAALCGLVGLKPTYGLISRYGLVAFASSLDQISPFSRTVEDAAAILQVIAGFDGQDSTSLDLPVPDYLSALKQPLEQSFTKAPLRVGVLQELDGAGMQPEVAEAFQKSLETFKAMGAQIQSVSIPGVKHAIASYYILATAEASSNLARFDGVRYGHRAEDADNITAMYGKTRAQGFGPEVKRRIILGTFCLSSGYYDAYYGKAQKVRELLRREFEAAWQQVDVLLCPTSPSTAFKIGEKANDPVSMYLSDIATIPVNLVGIPALSIPCGFDQEKLPIGLQLMGPHLSEARLLQIAHAFESRSGFGNLLPPLVSSKSPAGSY
jgi:aspartyl-tRNA(Asn)/glutamyl-tRNA(Gln) amidotransferase subunit A